MTKKINFGFTPSPYQEKFFDWVQHGSGNCVIRAAAGSGKTASAVAAMKLIPKTEQSLFIAFNKSIAEELDCKISSMRNASARTFHSLGNLMVQRNVGNVSVDEYKYRTYIKKNLPKFMPSTGYVKLNRESMELYVNAMMNLVNFSRLYICQSPREIAEIADKYEIVVNETECNAIRECLEWGKNNLETIDFTDMIWLPVELSMQPMGLKYDWVFVDECQDLSFTTIELFQKCIARGGRFVAIGDDSQCINAFAGSFEGSFDKLRELPHTRTFELPISYRCPKEVVKYACTFLEDGKEMYAREDAPIGEIKKNCHIDELQDGDMVLSRTKSPLLTLYIRLLRKGVNCHIKGLDIGMNLIKMLETVSGSVLNADLKSDGVFVRLFDEMFDERNLMMEKSGIDFVDATTSAPIVERYDTLNALLILSEGINDKDTLIGRIRGIFDDHETKGVCLSTIHKAKGLEADNVYILCDSMMPSKLAHTEWEKEQERNLQYVAYTRSKKKLGFISEDEIKPSGASQDKIVLLNELGSLERIVCKVLGKEPMDTGDNVEMAKLNLRDITDVKDLHDEDNAEYINNGYVADRPTSMMLDSKGYQEDLMERVKKILVERGDIKLDDANEKTSPSE